MPDNMGTQHKQEGANAMARDIFDEMFDAMDTYDGDDIEGLFDEIMARHEAAPKARVKSNRPPTGKSLGLAKGDMCVNTAGWACLILSDAHTFAPCCRVWGFENECGSVYATELRKVSEQEFNAAKVRMGFAA